MQIKRTLTLVACLFALAGVAPAHAERATGTAALGGGLGGAAGAAIGAELGGRDGAVLGGALGGGLGAGIGYDQGERDWRDRDDRRYDRRDEGRRDRSYGLQPRGGYFCPPGQAKKGNC